MTSFTLRTFDLPAIHRHAIGFDQLFAQLDRHFANSKSDGNYPPHNVVRLDDTHYVIEVAVAGFAEGEIDINVNQHQLTISGEQKREDDANHEYLHRGISSRNFTRTFPLAENIQVRGASVENGILAVALEMVVPEEKKSKKIAIAFNK